MSLKQWQTPCRVDGCERPAATRLGVCGQHWDQLSPELRTGWMAAWHDSARVKDWTTARRRCLKYLTGRAA